MKEETTPASTADSGNGKQPPLSLEERLRGKIFHDPKYFDAPVDPNICDGCGLAFPYPIHDHYYYRSCSIACDEIINDYLNN